MLITDFRLSLSVPGGTRVVKNPPANAGDLLMRVRFLGQKGPLE